MREIKHCLGQGVTAILCYHVMIFQISRFGSKSYIHLIYFPYIENVNLAAFEVRKHVKFTVSTDVEKYIFYKENVGFISIKAVTYF